MNSGRYGTISLILVILVLAGGFSVRAEVVDEIVAWVGGDIITKSELDQAEEELIGDLYRRYTGEELDRQVALARETLLQQLIDQKILYLRAARLFEMDIMEKAIMDMFMEQQKIESEEELKRLLAQEGMTLEGFKRRMVERVAPDEVLRLEVSSRISVGDKEVEEFYQEHMEEFKVETKITLRELVLLANDENREEQRKEAARLHALAAAPEADFESLVLEYSQAGTKDQGGLLGPLGVGDLSEALAEQAVSLPVGTVSDIIEMPYGFHLIKVEDRTEQYTKPLEEVSDTIRSFIEDKKYVEGIREFLEKARSETEWRVNDKYAHRIPENSE